MADEPFDEPFKPQRDYDKYPLTEDERYWVEKGAEFERRSLEAMRTGRQTIILTALHPGPREEMGKGRKFGVAWHEVEIFDPEGSFVVCVESHKLQKLIREVLQELKPKRRLAGRPRLPNGAHRDEQIRRYFEGNHTLEETAAHFNVSVSRVDRCRRGQRGE